jgi:hypothetical protein
MSKFLLNLLLQISKALVNSKIQFLFENFFSSEFSPLGPAGLPTPLALACRPAQAVQPLPGPNRLAHLASQPLGPCVPLAYFIEDVFLFGSHLPEPAAFSLCHRHAGPACQFRRLPRADRPRSEFSSHRRSPAPLPAPRMPPSLYNPPSSLSPLNPLQTER